MRSPRAESQANGAAGWPGRGACSERPERGWWWTTGPGVSYSATRSSPPWTQKTDGSWLELDLVAWWGLSEIDRPSDVRRRHRRRASSPRGGQGKAPRTRAPPQWMGLASLTRVEADKERTYPELALPNPYGGAPRPGCGNGRPLEQNRTRHSQSADRCSREEGFPNCSVAQPSQPITRPTEVGSPLSSSATGSSSSLLPG